MFIPKYRIGDIVIAEVFKDEWRECEVEIVRKRFLKHEYILSCELSFVGSNGKIYITRKEKDIKSLKRRREW